MPRTDEGNTVRSKLLAGVVVATIGFLLATNPVVVDAAGQITGKDIKNSSVKGKDIRNGSLTGDDIKETTLAPVPDAAALGGSPPARYLNESYRYGLPVQAPATIRTYTLAGLAPGSYAFSYSVIAQLSIPGAPLYCHVRSGVGAGQQLAGQYGSDGGSYTSVAGSAVVEVEAGTAPVLSCEALDGSFALLSQPSGTYPSGVVLTRVEPPATRTAASSKESGRRGPAGP